MSKELEALLNYGCPEHILENLDECIKKFREENQYAGMMSSYSGVCKSLEIECNEFNKGLEVFMECYNAGIDVMCLIQAIVIKSRNCDETIAHDVGMILKRVCSYNEKRPGIYWELTDSVENLSNLDSMLTHIGEFVAFKQDLTSVVSSTTFSKWLIGDRDMQNFHLLIKIDLGCNHSYKSVRKEYLAQFLKSATTKAISAIQNSSSIDEYTKGLRNLVKKIPSLQAVFAGFLKEYFDVRVPFPLTRALILKDVKGTVEKEDTIYFYNPDQRYDWECWGDMKFFSGKLSSENILKRREKRKKKTEAREKRARVIEVSD
jgi:hypothetical protein